MIVHGWESSRFAAFLVTCSGINATPVITSTGSVHFQDIADNNMVGQMKVSPNGKKLALFVFNGGSNAGGLMELFDFNDATGVVSNPITFPVLFPGQINGGYGVEFSPDGTKLYGTLLIPGLLYQYDLMAGSPTDIFNSRALVGKAPSDIDLASLQLGPDGKIYCARNDMTSSGTDYLGVINNPNALSNNCNYVDKGVFLDIKGQRNWSKGGLPTFMQSYFYPSSPFTYVNSCVGDTTFFSITNTGNADSVLWNFGDTASGIYNSSAEFNPYHLFSDTGSYNVQLIKYGKCPITFNQTVIVKRSSPLPPINLVYQPFIGYLFKLLEFWRRHFKQ